MNRRTTHVPSRLETRRWFLLRVCIVEGFLIVALVLVMTTHIAGVR